MKMSKDGKLIIYGCEQYIYIYNLEKNYIEKFKIDHNENIKSITIS